MAVTFDRNKKIIIFRYSKKEMKDLKFRFFYECKNLTQNGTTKLTIIFRFFFDDVIKNAFVSKRFLT